MGVLKLQNIQEQNFEFPDAFRENVLLTKNLIEHSTILTNRVGENKGFKYTQLVDFSNIKNEKLKEELQYCVYIFANQNYKYSEFTRNIGALKNYLILFLNENNHDSIINKNIKNEYEKYLLENNISLIEKGRFDYNEKMEKVQYYSISRPFGILEKCQKIITNYLNSNLKEYEKDKWVLSNLNIKVINNDARPVTSLSFIEIKQQKIKEAIKAIMYERLKVASAKTAREILVQLRCFTNWLYEKHKEIISLDMLNRKIIEEYMSFIRTNPDLSAQTIYSRIQQLKIFLDYCILYDIDNIPKKVLMTDNDYHWKRKTMVKFYTDEEVQHLNEHIGKLPIKYGRMLFVVENVGMRGSEICCLESNCLSQNKNGDYYLTYFQIKTKQYNTIPINNVVAEAINAGLNESKKLFGEDVKYVFAEGKNEPTKKDKFNRNLNKWCYENNILDKNGDIIRVKLHKFRGTIATKYINLGVDLEIIRKLLGHSSTKAIYHYVEIHNDTVLTAMKPIIDIQENMISNIGNIEKVQNDILQNNEYIQLSNGMCCKPIGEGICKHANACLTCKMFKYDKSYLPLYENQLNEVNANIEIATSNGFERILEYNLELKNSLEKIINQIKGV